MTKASVLVGESDPDVRRLLVVLVERLGHQAIVVGPGAVPPPSVDLMLLEPDSPLCLEHARLARLDSPELPVVAFGLVPAHGWFLTDGPLEYLPKPFTIEHLREVVERALRSQS